MRKISKEIVITWSTQQIFPSWTPSIPKQSQSYTLIYSEIAGRRADKPALRRNNIAPNQESASGQGHASQGKGRAEGRSHS